jgi:hypothetical protein
MKPGRVMLLSLRDIAIGMAIYIVFLYGGFGFLSAVGESLGQNLAGAIFVWIMAILLMLSPVVPMLFFIRATVRLVQNSDELQQRIFLYAIGFAAAATGLLTFAYGLLEFNGYPPLDMTTVIPSMLILWFVGLLYFKWRFR